MSVGNNSVNCSLKREFLVPRYDETSAVNNSEYLTLGGDVFVRRIAQSYTQQFWRGHRGVFFFLFFFAGLPDTRRTNVQKNISFLKKRSSSWYQEDHQKKQKKLVDFFYFLEWTSRSSLVNNIRV